MIRLISGYGKAKVGSEEHLVATGNALGFMTFLRSEKQGYTESEFPRRPRCPRRQEGRQEQEVQARQEEEEVQEVQEGRQLVTVATRTVIAARVTATRNRTRRAR